MPENQTQLENNSRPLFPSDTQDAGRRAGSCSPPEPSPAPAPDFDDPFAHIPDARETARRFSNEEKDREADVRAKRDRANAKRKATKRRQADLESKTRELLRSMGYRYGRTETVGFSGLKKDLFGFVDGIGVRSTDVLFVQTTSRDHYADHVKKMATGDFKIGNGAPNPCFDVAKCFIELAEAATEQGDRPGTSGRTEPRRPLVRFAIVVWDQPGGPGTAWRYEFKEPTLADLEAYRARSRKRGAA